MGRRTFVVASGSAAVVVGCGESPFSRRDAGMDAGVGSDAGSDAGVGPGPGDPQRADGNVLRSTVPNRGDADTVVYSSPCGANVLEVAPLVQQPGYLRIAGPFDSPQTVSVEAFRLGQLDHNIRSVLGDSVLEEVRTLVG